MQLSYRSVLPALFPSAVVCGLLTEVLEFLPLPANHSLWITAQLCGFPLGIKSVCRAYQRELIDKQTAIALSYCCANASPAFLILYVGGSILGDLQSGIALFTAQFLISFGIAILNGAFIPCPRIERETDSLFAIWGNGISNATLGSLGLTGYICLFSAIAAPMERFRWFQYLHGFLELTGGISKSKSNQLLLCGAMVGFSGVSVFLQNAAHLAQAQLPIFPAFCGKLIYGITLPLLLFLGRKNQIVTPILIICVFVFWISFDKYRKRRYNNSIQYKRRRYL